MKNFLRAVRLSLRHRLTIFGILLSSLLVAIFWGANIGTVYPFIEVVFRGDSMCDWVDRQVVQSRQRSSEIRERIGQLEVRQADPSDAAAEAERQRQLAFQRNRLQAEAKALSWATYWQPRIHRYLPNQPFQTLLLIVGWVLAGTLAKDVFLVTSMVLVERLGQQTTMELRKQFYRRLLQMELGVFWRGRTGALMSNFTCDIGAINGGLSTLFGKTLREPLKMIVCVAGAAMVSWRLLLFSLAVTPAACVVIYSLARSLRRANRRSLEEMARFFNRLSESLGGIEVVVAFTMERSERQRFHQQAKQLYRKSMKLAWYNALARMNSEVLGIAVISLAILSAGYLVLSQQTHLLGIKMTDRPMTFGSMMLFYAFLAGVSDPARKLADVYSFLQGAAAGADRLYPLLDRESAIRDPACPAPLPATRRDLTFEGVSFCYDTGNMVLRDIHLQVRHGETLAIVGPNGCGKTTLASLIPRFCDPVKGSVRLGGVDLRDFRLRDLRRQIGIVTQHTVLFDGNVRENIRYGSLLASDDQVEQAAQKARVDRFLDALERGYDTNIGERGGRLSGGQRQRIALARAILRDPSILILDEATSQIDPESEQLIQRVLEEFIRERTTILITHRLSTLKLADRILVLDSGVIIDLGAHDELMARCDVYRRLHQTEFRRSA